MIVTHALCLLWILMGLSQVDAHEVYLPEKKFQSKFRTVEVPGIQECIETCNLDRKCTALAMTGHAQCFIEDPTGSVTPESLSDLSIMVKSSINKCGEDCPSDFMTLGLTGGCYYPVKDQTLDWESAEAACQEFGPGSHLISINNQEEAVTVKEYLTEMAVQIIWTGGQDLVHDGVFTWIGSQEEIDADRWLPWEPTGSNSQLCVLFYRSHSLLSDSDCRGLTKFICEIQTANGEN